MIRRGFWLVLGAVLGVAGYRKASQVAQTITGGQAARATTGVSPRRSVEAPGRLALPGVRLLAQDEDGVQPGGRHRDRQAAVAREVPVPILIGQRLAATASFVRDVRQGMAQYRDLHDREAGRSLEDRDS
jgi:hypothetical protein